MIDEYIKEYIAISKKIINHLSADIDLEVKVDYLEELIEKRFDLQEKIENSEYNKDDYKKSFREILDLNIKISTEFEELDKLNKKELKDIINKKSNINKSKKLNDSYNPFNEKSYYINEKK